jgi:aryl-alcohol dehydrogenase-like predicted oxidoreductase
MRYRLLGNTGLRVSEMFLGTMTFGEPDGMGASLEECRKVLDAYTDAGGNVLDTAVNYRGGASEEFLGELLGRRRDRFVLATKYTVSRDRDDPNAAGNHRKNLRLSLETSLRRLRTDYVDVLWVHMWDRHTPIEETVRALDDVVRSGKVLYLGVGRLNSAGRYGPTLPPLSGYPLCGPEGIGPGTARFGAAGLGICTESGGVVGSGIGALKFGAGAL